MQKQTAFLVAPGCRGHLTSAALYEKYKDDDDLSRGMFPVFKRGRANLVEIRCLTGNTLKAKSEAFKAFELASVELQISGRRFLLAPAHVFLAGIRVEIPVHEDDTFEVFYAANIDARRAFAKELPIKVDLTFEGEEA